MLYDSVSENIDQIREIEAQYLSAIDDEIRAASMVDEEEMLGEDEEE